MKTLLAAITILLAGCASQYGTGEVMNNNHEGDFGPYFMVPTGGLAATSYWGLSYYNPWLPPSPWGPWDSWGR